MVRIKWLMSVIGGMIAAFFEQYGILIALVGVAIVFDLITGLMKAKMSKEEGFNSEKCARGLFKKIALLVGMCFGFYLDMLIPYVFEYVNVTIPISMPFSMIISFYIVLNESISVCENLYATNPEILPKWIISLLTNAKESLLKETEPGKEE